MNKIQAFSLVSFPSEIVRSNLTISGFVYCRDRFLSLHYQIDGDTEKLLIPVAIAKPHRQDELWQETCFEFFLRPQNSSQYWEFNLSPSGNWNIYHFDDYRQGMKEERGLEKLPFLVREEHNRVSLEIEIDLSAIAASERVLEVAISTVIKHKDGSISYYALAHPSKQADFHHRDSFSITLD